MSIIAKARYGMGLVAARLTGKHHPLFVTLCITGKCNAKCIYCYGDYYFKDNGPGMSTAEILTLIEQLVAQGTRYIAVSGGEPLLHPEVGRIVDFIKAQGCECALGTNGHLLSAKIQAVARADVMAVSLDGDEAAHDLNRGPGSFKLAMAGIAAAIANRNTVMLNAVLTKNNISSIDYLVNLARRLKVKVKFAFLVYSDDKRRQDIFKTIELTNDEIRAALEQIIILKQAGAPILYSRETYRHALAWRDYSRKSFSGAAPDFTHARCMAGKSWCLIDSNGKVYPCCEVMDSFPAKNYLQVGLAEALAHAAHANTCRACYTPGLIEHNLLCGLNVKVIGANILAALKR